MDAGAVVAGDVAAHRLVELCATPEAVTVNGLCLQRMEERFNVRIIGHGLRPVHALDDAAVGKAIPVQVTTVLAPTVRVEYEARARAACHHGPPQRGNGQVGRALVAQLVAKEPAAR